MQLEQQINTAIKEAMLQKDAVRLQALRAVKSAILLQKTSGKKQEFTRQEEYMLLEKLIKQRKEAMAVFKEQGRAELAEKEAKEMEYISAFLPPKMSEETLHQIIQEGIATHQITQPQQAGRLYGLLRSQLAGHISAEEALKAITAFLSKG